MRRRVRLYISQGEAKKILDVVPRIEDYSSLYLAMLPMNAVRNSRMVHKVDLGAALTNVHAGYAFVLPRVQATKDEIKASGGAAFKGDRMVGWISELEMEAIKFIRNLYLGGVVTVKAPGFENGMVTLEITKAHSRITPLIDDEDVRFQVDIQVECNFGEAINMHSHGKINSELLKKLELECSREIERICRQTIRRTQEELKTDIFLSDHLLETKKPAFWKKVGKQWDIIFPDVEVDVKVDTEIILIGLVK
ncbi:MAG: Ger(x)C family spore germination protein [Clostridia bacterium]|jgi:Ger(x)C family germination protein